MSHGAYVMCDGCGDRLDDDTLSPREMLDSAADLGWVTCHGLDGRWFDVCPRDECADNVAVLAGVR